MNVVVDDVGVGFDAEVGAGLGDDAGEEVDGSSVVDHGAGVDVDEGDIPTIFGYLNQMEPDDNDENSFCDALNFAKKYVGTRIIDSDEEDAVDDSDSDDEFSLNGRGGELIIG